MLQGLRGRDIRKERKNGWMFKIEHVNTFGLIGYDYYLDYGDVFIVIYTCQNSRNCIY